MTKRENLLMAAEDTRLYGLADLGAVAARVKRAQKCCNYDVCQEHKDNLILKNNVLWKKCPGKNCRVWCCCDISDANSSECNNAFVAHQGECQNIH
jgi:hypothetical protein